MRIAALLGGEIGIEKENKAQTEKYAHLRTQSRRRTDAARTSVKRESPGKGPSTSGKRKSALPQNRIDSSRGMEAVRRAESRLAGRAAGPRGEHPRTTPKGPGYWGRVRINFLAAHRDHRIMTLGGAILSLVPSPGKQERVNPSFIQDSRNHLLDPLKAVHHGSNILFREGNRRGGLYRPHPFYEEVMKILASWEVEKIDSEIELLETNPRKLSVENCAALCQVLYSPLVRLLALEGAPLESAIRHYYKLIVLRNSENASKDTIKEAVHEVMNNLPILFHRLRYGCYPLLLKLTGSSFIRYEDFFTKHRDKYLTFLNLREEDILIPPDLLPPVSPEEMSDTPPGFTAKSGKKKEISRNFVESILVLQEMFPQAGFENLKAFPDLLPYFSSFIPFLRDFALISPKDPLHSIVVIMGILREFFFAFGGVKMRTLKNEDWNLKDPRSAFERYTLQWTRHLEDYLPKQILSPLKEYCREREGPAKQASAYGHRIESNILHLKRNLYLPYLKIPKSTFPAPPLLKGQQKLWHLVDDLTSFLTSMSTEISSGENSAAVINPQDPIQFEVEGLVSKRFRVVMKRRGQAFTNSVLIAQTAALTGILGEFLNNPDSFYYHAPPVVTYRTVKEDSIIPQYKVEPLNTERLFLESDRRLDKGKKAEAHDGKHGFNRLISSLEKALESLQQTKIPSSLLLIAAERPEEGVKFRALLEWGLREDDSWYHHSEGGYAALLENTSGEQAVILVHRLQKRMGTQTESGGTFVGITPLKEGWSPEEAISYAEKALAESQRHGGRAIILFDIQKDRYRAFAPVPQ